MKVLFKVFIRLSSVTFCLLQMSLISQNSP